MPKKVMLITSFVGVAEVHAASLKALFGNDIELVCHSFDRGNIDVRLTADLFVFSIYPIYLNVKPWLPRNAKTVIISNTITNEQYERIRALPRGTAALLVNYSVEMTMDTISLLRQLGLDHIDYLPFYPGVTDLPGAELAITPGEAEHVPPSIRRVIDIGHRVIDEKTIVDIAHFLGLEGLLQEERVARHFAGIKRVQGGVATLFDLTNVLENQLSGLLEALEDGVVVVDDAGTVYAGNAKALEVLGERGSLVGKSIGELVPGIPLDQVLRSGLAVGDRLMKVKSRDVSLRLVPILSGGRASGVLVIVGTFDEKEKTQHILRSQLLGKGHRAKYTFDSIMGRDEQIEAIKNLARRQARSNSSVLIIGETGTGKELFAHAIHDASERKNWQFVTVNCAALPESLLESELFGYAEGAFTGARKGGKPGLFELAHKGTIFLDEIGEMEMGLQARLLRVLESREVMRIGGDNLIHVDIRVIAATNQDLRGLVEEGRFRKDLYFRLNVLPIEVPPLRRRKGDILPIFEGLKRSLGAGFRLDAEASAALLEHPWSGNIRELKNCVEYLACLEKELIEARDLQPIIRRAPPAAPKALPAEPRLPEAGAPDEEHTRFVLGCLYDSYRQRVRAGRRSIQESAERANLFLTEAQIRTILTWLDRRGLARLSSGRAGTAITQAGIEWLGLAKDSGLSALSLGDA
ncbi:MAG: sigma 54-interacting transcriptional regulator [Spirochaetaceae bacterium]|nr:sigma 54-interacting transcriptional regulator [Spirochaetaceae bacterium]